MAKLTVKDVDLKGKKVLVRVDFNVPLKDGVITNDNRISAALPTIKYIIEQGGRAILFSHLGRVKEEADKAGKSLAPVAADLAAKLGQDVAFPGATRGSELEAAIAALEDGQVLLVENTRFEDVDGKKESKNDPELGQYWASLGDGIFVNDAFGTAHRAHASNVGISANVEKAVAGFLLENEIAYIQEAVDNPVRPFIAILGGSKVSDKIGVIENLLEKADKVLIGGGMTYTFYIDVCQMDRARGPAAGRVPHPGARTAPRRGEPTRDPRKRSLLPGAPLPGRVRLGAAPRLRGGRGRGPAHHHRGARTPLCDPDNQDPHAALGP